MNTEGLALLRALIFKMWALNEAREHNDLETMAITINSWMPPGCKVTPEHIHAALSMDRPPGVTVNVAVLRSKIDKTKELHSARLSCDYQAILNEVATDPELRGVTLADVVEAMALRPPERPNLVVVGSGKLVGAARM